jgi:hypothetical protein
LAEGPPGVNLACGPTPRARRDWGGRVAIGRGAQTEGRENAAKIGGAAGTTRAQQRRSMKLKLLARSSTLVALVLSAASSLAPSYALAAGDQAQPGLALSATVAGGWTSSSYHDNGLALSLGGAGIDPRFSAGWRTGRIQFGATLGALLVPKLSHEAVGFIVAQSLYVPHGGAFATVRPLADWPLDLTGRLELAHAIVTGGVSLGAADPHSPTPGLGSSTGGLASLSATYAAALTPSESLVFGLEAFTGWLTATNRHVEPRGAMAVVGARWN